MGWEFSDMVRFNLGPLHQGQTRTVKLKVLITCLLLVLVVCSANPTYRKSWVRNFLMWSDLTLVLSFKVKELFTGIGELSFRYKFASLL